MQTSASESRDRLAFIDFCRGAACLWVVLYHGMLYGLLPGVPNLDPLLAPVAALTGRIAGLGYLGVHLFLVVSGFCLTWPLVRRGTPLREACLDLKDFARRRALRILPPYWAALALFALLCAIPNLPVFPPTVWWDLPAHFLLVHNLSPVTIGTVNGSFWSLALEAQLYAVFPLLLVLVRRRGLRFTLIAAFLVSLLWQRGVAAVVPASADWNLSATTYFALPGRLFQFVCGMAAAVLVARRRSEGSAAPTPPAGAELLLALALAVALGLSNGGATIFTVWADHLWGVIFAGLLVCLARVPAPWYDRRLARALVGLGTISFSVYLIHQPLLQLLGGTVFQVVDIPPAARFASFWLLCLPFLVMAGRVFHGLFEAPTWLKRFQQRGNAVMAQSAIATLPGTRA